MEFNIDDTVWVYQFGLPPFIGTVSEVCDMGIRVRKESLFVVIDPNSVHHPANVYHRPGDKEKLIERLRDNAADIEQWARELEGSE